MDRRHMEGNILFAGLVLGLFIGVSTARSSDFDIVVNEIHYHPANQSGEDEFL